ncbi:hypothetical protein [Aquabacterium soli]|uniref:hypothetical protein n=1 Tax=Aquabacterium soli TaxID=2493092 RepID=UPI00131527D5|nr:hypothetical protein [Aquabacterium soli]
MSEFDQAIYIAACVLAVISVYVRVVMHKPAAAMWLIKAALLVLIAGICLT